MRTALVTLAAVSALGLLLAAQSRERLEVVLPRDAIPAIDDPEFVAAPKADAVMQDDELVIGLVGTMEQRAYSTWQLDQHEIVNDVFEGSPVAVTW